MIVSDSILRRKLRSLALKLLHFLENNNNTDCNQNGEVFFLNQLLSTLRESSEKIVLFDVGANIGDYTQTILSNRYIQSKNHLEIHVFEPTRQCFQMLENRFHQTPQVILNQKAISDQEGQSEIFYDETGSSLASLYKRDLDSIGIFLNQSELVDTITLRHYIQNKQIEHISLLKIDVEGHELRVLNSLGEYLNKDFIDLIQFEYGGTNLDSRTRLKDFYDLLEPREYTIAKVMPRGLTVRAYQAWMDSFQYANYVAISNAYLARL